MSASIKKIFFLKSWRFELEGITKHLMTGPKGNSEFCIPQTLKILIFMGPVNTCLMLLFFVNLLLTENK